MVLGGVGRPAILTSLAAPDFIVTGGLTFLTIQ